MVSHSAENRMIAEKRTRSTRAPMISALVIAAKLIWNAAKTSSGMALPLLPAGQADESVSPANPALAKPPTSPPPSSKARL